MSDCILLDVTDGIATITLNRPDKGNAIDLDMARRLADIAIICDEDPVVLRPTES